MPDKNADTATQQEGFRSTPFRPDYASNAMVSLSQAILAPLDALAKAQVHAARSFLNFVLQIGYPHIPVTEEGRPIKTDGPCYTQTFRLEQRTGKDGGDGRQTIELTIPTLALVPLHPMGIESADYNIELVIREVARHRQIQVSEKSKLRTESENADTSEAMPQGEAPHEPRPWYLVDEPISIRGNLSDPGGTGETAKLASIKVNVKVARSQTPAGLAKLLSTMTQLSGSSHSSGQKVPEDPSTGDTDGN